MENTVLCETLDVARDLCFNRKEQVKAVTLEGAVISKSGTMPGGNTATDSDRAKTSTPPPAMTMSVLTASGAILEKCLTTLKLNVYKSSQILILFDSIDNSLVKIKAVWIALFAELEKIISQLLN